MSVELYLFGHQSCAAGPDRGPQGGCAVPAGQQRLPGGQGDGGAGGGEGDK